MLVRLTLQLGRVKLELVADRLQRFLELVQQLIDLQLGVVDVLAVGIFVLQAFLPEALSEPANASHRVQQVLLELATLLALGHGYLDEVAHRKDFVAVIEGVEEVLVVHAVDD